MNSFFFIRIGCLLSFGLVLASCYADGGTSMSEPTTRPNKVTEVGAGSMQRISIEIGGMVSNMTGKQWPLDAGGHPATSMSLEEPYIIAILLPGGHSLEHFSRRTYFAQDNGFLLSTSFIPNVQAVPYQQAIIDLESIFKDWNCIPIQRSQVDL